MVQILVKGLLMENQTKVLLVQCLSALELPNIGLGILSDNKT